MAPLESILKDPLLPVIRTWSYEHLLLQQHDIQTWSTWCTLNKYTHWIQYSVQVHRTYVLYIPNKFHIYINAIYNLFYTHLQHMYCIYHIYEMYKGKLISIWLFRSALLIMALRVGYCKPSSHAILKFLSAFKTEAILHDSLQPFWIHWYHPGQPCLPASACTAVETHTSSDSEECIGTHPCCWWGVIQSWWYQCELAQGLGMMCFTTNPTLNFHTPCAKCCGPSQNSNPSHLQLCLANALSESQRAPCSGFEGQSNH